MSTLEEAVAKHERKQKLRRPESTERDVQLQLYNLSCSQLDNSDNQTQLLTEIRDAAQWFVGLVAAIMQSALISAVLMPILLCATVLVLLPTPRLAGGVMMVEILTWGAFCPLWIMWRISRRWKP